MADQKKPVPIWKEIRRRYEYIFYDGTNFIFNISCTTFILNIFVKFSKGWEAEIRTLPILSLFYLTVGNPFGNELTYLD